jgi:hypothetical protein
LWPLRGFSDLLNWSGQPGPSHRGRLAAHPSGQTSFFNYYDLNNVPTSYTINTKSENGEVGYYVLQYWVVLHLQMNIKMCLPVTQCIKVAISVNMAQKGTKRFFIRWIHNKSGNRKMLQCNNFIVKFVNRNGLNCLHFCVVLLRWNKIIVTITLILIQIFLCGKLIVNLFNWKLFIHENASERFPSWKVAIKGFWSFLLVWVTAVVLIYVRATWLPSPMKNGKIDASSDCWKGPEIYENHWNHVKYYMDVP